MLFRSYEVVSQDLEILTSPIEPYPVNTTPQGKEKLETNLRHRAISLRNPRAHRIIRLQQSIAQSFREFMSSEGFTEIFTPKIVPQVAESGSDMFPIDYFGNPRISNSKSPVL